MSARNRIQAQPSRLPDRRSGSCSCLPTRVRRRFLPISWADQQPQRHGPGDGARLPLDEGRVVEPDGQAAEHRDEGEGHPEQRVDLLAHRQLARRSAPGWPGTTTTVASSTGATSACDDAAGDDRAEVLGRETGRLVRVGVRQEVGDEEEDDRQEVEKHRRGIARARSQGGRSFGAASLRPASGAVRETLPAPVPKVRSRLGDTVRQTTVPGIPSWVWPAKLVRSSAPFENRSAGDRSR